MRFVNSLSGEFALMHGALDLVSTDGQKVVEEEHRGLDGQSPGRLELFLHCFCLLDCRINDLILWIFLRFALGLR